MNLRELEASLEDRIGLKKVSEIRIEAISYVAGALTRRGLNPNNPIYEHEFTRRLYFRYLEEYYFLEE